MRRMYRYKFTQFCGCLQEYFVLLKFGQELSMVKAIKKGSRGILRNIIQAYSLVKWDVEKLTLL